MHNILREDELAKATEKTSKAAKEDAKPAAKKPAAKKAPAVKAAAAAKPATAKASTTAKPKSTPAKTAAKRPAAKPAATAAATPVDAPAAAPAPAKSAAVKVSTPKTTAKPAAKKPAAKAAKPAAGKAAEAPAASKPATSKATAPAAKTKPAAASAPKTEAAASPAAKQSAAKADKPWIANYPNGVPAEIAPLEYQSLGDLMVESCRRYGSKPAFTCMGKSITFSELEKQSAAFAAYLQGKGLSKGARVAIMMPNVLQYPIAMMAVLRAGYTVVNVNPLYTPRELEHQLNDSGAEAIVILENFAATLQQVIGRTKIKHVVVAAMGDRLGLKGIVVNLVVRRVKKMVPAWSLPGHVAFNDALKEGAKKTFRKIDVGHNDVAFLQYTGGTTGVSKGATLLHRNVLANVAQNALWVEAAYSKKPKPKDVVYICALPLYHIYALTVNALMGMQQGAQNILIPNPRDIPAFVKELQKTPFHVFPGLNTLFNALLNNADFQKLDFKPLILTFGGGMAVQKPVADRWKKLTGIVIAEGYGLSETSRPPTGSMRTSSPARSGCPSHRPRSSFATRTERTCQPAMSAKSAFADHRSWQDIGTGRTRRRRS
jgi:long-chain acyl-CoA synthetase